MATMGINGIEFSPVATPNKYDLTLTIGTGISTIYYKIGNETKYTETTVSEIVNVDYGTDIFCYATPIVNWKYDEYTFYTPYCTSMTTSGIQFEPIAGMITHKMTLSKSDGVSTIYYKINYIIFIIILFIFVSIFLC